MCGIPEYMRDYRHQPHTIVYADPYSAVHSTYYLCTLTHRYALSGLVFFSVYSHLHIRHEDLDKTQTL